MSAITAVIQIVTYKKHSATGSTFDTFNLLPSIVSEYKYFTWTYPAE